MVKFTVEQFENPPTTFGVLQGTFGVRVFNNQMAGLKAVDGLEQFLPLQERERLKELILASRKLPDRGENLEMEELVSEALPTNRVM